MLDCRHQRGRKHWGCMARSQLQLTVFVEPDTATKKYGAEQVDFVEKAKHDHPASDSFHHRRKERSGMDETGSADKPKISATGLAADLAQRDEDGNPIRVCIIGAGEMGTDLVTAIRQMRGVEIASHRRP